MKLRIILYIAILIIANTTILSPLAAQIVLPGTKTNSEFLEKEKPKLSVSLSTSFSSFGYGYTALGTSIMPQITFPVSKKISITGGIGYSTFLMGNNEESVFNSQPSSYGHIFVSGNYLLNEKITVRGTAYKTFSLSDPTIGSGSEMPNYNFDSQGIIMDVEYKVTDNFRINVGFEYRKQNYPMYGPMTPNMGNNSPFMDFNNHRGFGRF